jgi:hypothetical protein
VQVNPRVIDWACERSGKPRAALEKRFKALPEWLSGKKQPTLKQFNDFAAATLTPPGALLLDEPPAEALPVPDFRTAGRVYPSPTCATPSGWNPSRLTNCSGA